MALLPWQLRRRKKLITAWVCLLVFAGFVAGRSYCTTAGGAARCGIVQEWLLYLWKPVLLVAAAILLRLIWKRWDARPEEVDVPIWEDPWNYADTIVAMQGRVEFILKDTVGEHLKRKVTDLYRNVTSNNDRRNRYIHQRFLISSPALRSDERLMVHHNTRFGKLRLRPGMWVEVQGEYLHEPGPRRHFYGILHHTHEPLGHLRVLSAKPSRSKEFAVRFLGRRRTRSVGAR